jgi:hypothetical protein
MNIVINGVINARSDRPNCLKLEEVEKIIEINKA